MAAYSTFAFNHGAGQASQPPVWFTPDLESSGGIIDWWIRQAVLRLRRELCWAWRKPQAPDPVTEALDRSRLHEQRGEFFERDDTARYLSSLIAEPAPPLIGPPQRGTLPWIALEFTLAREEIFVAALALLHSWDAAAAEVIGAAQGDARRTLPTLGLAQRLWDEPGGFSQLTALGHRLFRFGILRPEAQDSIDWRTPLTMPQLVAARLLGVDSAPSAFTVVRGNAASPRLPLGAHLVALRASEPIDRPHAVPMRTASALVPRSGADIRPLLEGFSAVTGRPVYISNPSRSAAELHTSAALCWLDGADLFLERPADPALAPFEAVPIHTLSFWEQERLEIPGWSVLPPIDLPALDFAARLECWRDSFPLGAAPPDDILEDCAFRFRFAAPVIREIARAMARDEHPVSGGGLVAACRQRAEAAPGNLAIPIKPRFRMEELVLPAAQQRQFAELIAAIQSLSQVHSRWGTGRVWDEAGISALFAGAPGTGKTMAAEVLAARLGLPMYRVDLSQVVNKYIGETEKNLRRLFDSMEECDSLLFFDEAEALFGQRMQARNANDRFANMEISYLLQRMERFRGVAILATNRRKDLDEAFLRRLRFVIEFPLPDPPERKRIWTSAIPAEVDASSLDLEFLSRQYALSGGHIRSIILHACLQAASHRPEKRLTMDTVMLAVKREYQKLDRKLTREQCGKWNDSLEREDQ